MRSILFGLGTLTLNSIERKNDNVCNKSLESASSERQESSQGELPSERAMSQLLPSVLGTGDLISLFLLNVFWVTNITPIAIGGSSGFLYSGICGLTFFIPCSFVMAQLARMYPTSGGIVTWTYHALGAKWSFFVGICAWLPGILSI